LIPADTSPSRNIHKKAPASKAGAFFVPHGGFYTTYPNPKSKRGQRLDELPDDRARKSGKYI